MSELREKIKYLKSTFDTGTGDSYPIVEELADRQVDAILDAVIAALPHDAPHIRGSDNANSVATGYNAAIEDIRIKLQAAKESR